MHSRPRYLILNYIFGLLAGLLWFSQFIVYGMGKSKMGPFTFTSWGILMALTIAFATVWGLIRKRMEGSYTKDLYNYDCIPGYTNRFIFYDRDKWIYLKENHASNIV